MISVTSGSRSNGSIGPWPRISSTICWYALARSLAVSASSVASTSGSASRIRRTRSSSLLASS